LIVRRAADYSMQSLESFSHAARTSRNAVVVTPSDYGYHSPSYYEDDNSCEMLVFGGWNSFTAGSDISDAGHDYDFDGNGGYVGVRLCGGEKQAFKGGLFFAYDTGTISSQNLSLDATGLMLGAFFDYRLTDTDLIFHGNLGYGLYSYDGTHSGATTSFENTAFKAAVGLDYILVDSDDFMLMPSISVTSLTTDADEFTESGGALPLTISDLSATSLLLDVGLKFEMDFPETFTGINGFVGYQQDMGDSEREVTASVNGSSFTVGNEGADAGAFIYNIGGYWEVSDEFRVNAHYFGESRSGARSISGWNVGATFSF